MIQNQEFEMHRIVRGKLAAYLDHYRMEQLTDIPYGHRNHIFWNVAHCLVTQQLLCYYLAGESIPISSRLIERYKKGSVPDSQTDISEDFHEVKSLLLSSAAQLQADLMQGDFIPFQPYPTSFGIVLHNTQESFRYNLMHENMHLGTILSMSKMV